MENIKRSRPELVRRYTVFIISLFFIALGVSLITRSLVGTSPISSIPYVLSIHSVLTMGTFILLLNIVLIILQMMMLGRKGINECKFGLVMQLPVSVLFGLFVDLTMAMLGFWHPDAYWMKLISLSLGCLSMAVGVSLEVLADVTMVSGEYFVHIASRRFKKEFGTVKIMFDVSLVVIAVGCSWILAGRIDGVREGTLTAAIVTGPLVRLIMPRLKFVERWETGERTAADRVSTHGVSASGNRVITIAREYGSGGHDIGYMIARRLGIPFYDNGMMTMVAKESGLNEDKVRQFDQKLPHGRLYEMITQEFPVAVERTLSTNDALFVAQSRVIRRLASEGPCVIVGRCSDYVLRDNPNCLHLYFHASDEYKYHRAVASYGLAESEAPSQVERINNARREHYAYYTGKRWDDIRNYDAVFDTSRLSADEICAAVAAMYVGELKS